jgi:hypothetical protein
MTARRVVTPPLQEDRSMLKKSFNQAVFSENPAVLAQINLGEINLAVLENALSPQARIYAERLNLPELCKDHACTDNYYFLLGRAKLDPEDPQRRQAIATLVSSLPEGGGKETLVDDMLKLSDEFARAASAQEIGMSLIAFRPGSRPGEGGYWHTDPGVMWTNITLAGERGMLWRPDESLPADQPRAQPHWGNVDPRTEPGIIQQINPGDLAVFKCRFYPNPLVHATPPGEMLRGWRLMMGMGKLKKPDGPPY